MILFNKKDIFKKIKAKVHDRKGLGMELAMMVLLVVLGCSIMMVSSAMWARDHLTAKEEQTMQRLEIDEFVEDTLTKGSYEKDSGNVEYTTGTYMCVKAGDNSFKILPNDENSENTALLKFEIEKKDTQITIKSWTYTKTGE